MNLSTIIYATDFSDASSGALQMAASLARDNDSRLLITHVIEPPVVDAAALYAQVAEQAKAEQTALLQAVVPDDRKVRYEHRVVEGVASQAIIDLAETEKADLIVIGTHGRTGLKRLLMGSVAESVVRHAPCPVLTVKQPDDGGQTTSGDNPGQQEKEVQWAASAMHESKRPTPGKVVR